MKDNDRHSGRETNDTVTRRRALQLAGTAGSIATIAGCLDGDGDGDGGDGDGGDGSDGSDGDGGDTPAEDDELVDETFVSLTRTNPMEVDYNPYTQNTDWWTLGPQALFATQYTSRSPTRVPMAFEDWELDGDVFRASVNDSFSWHDGRDFTADDLAFQYEMARHMETGDLRSIYDYAESVEVPDEYTIEFHLTTGDITENTVLSAGLGGPMYQHPDEWADFWERFQDASTDDEKQDVRADVLEFRVADPIGIGPLDLVERTEQEYVFEVYEDWPWDAMQRQFSEATGENITDWGRPNVENVEFKWAPDHQRMAQEWQGENVSGGITGGDLEEEQLPEGMEFIDIPSLYGIGLMWNFWSEDLTDEPGDPAWRDRNVRKALAYIIDREQVGIQYQGEGPAKSEIQTGMVKTHQEQWLEDDLLDQMTVYDNDWDKAEELLRASDYYKEDGQWYKPNGDQFEIFFNTGACVNYYVRGFEVATDNLEQFGIATEMEATDCSTFFEQPYPERGYQIATPGFYGGANPHPLAAYEFVYERPSYLPEGASEDERIYYMQDTMGSEFEVPPVGEPDSDDTITVNPHELIDELSTTSDEDDQKDILETLAWTTNQLVPKIEATEITLNYGINRNEWNYPATDSLALSVNPPSAFWWHLGIVDAKQ